MLPEQFAAFSAAAVKASPAGLTIVEEALDAAVKSIDEQLLLFDPKKFGTDGFIPGSAFGAADRSSEVALHHTRAHLVTEQVLQGVKKDLLHFRAACLDVRKLIVATDEAAGDDSRVLAARVLEKGATGGYGDNYYRKAVYETADAVPTEENPNPAAVPEGNAGDIQGDTQGDDQ